jgi:hypothetical protein
MLKTTSATAVGVVMAAMLTGAAGCAPGEGFCPTSPFTCQDGACADAGTPSAEECVTFEQAAELAKRGVRGIHKLTTAVDPVPWGFVSARAVDNQSVCKDGTCYLLPDGAVALWAVPDTQVLFTHWSGCSSSTESQLTVDATGADQECKAHFAAAFIVLAVSSTGWVDAPVHVTASSGCDAINGCVVFYDGSFTLTAPTDPAYRFVGWSGCSSSAEPVITLTNVRGPLPACVAEYEAVP